MDTNKNQKITIEHVNKKARYTPEESMFALKKMSIYKYLFHLMYDQSGKYDKVFEKGEEYENYEKL